MKVAKPYQSFAVANRGANAGASLTPEILDWLLVYLWADKRFSEFSQRANQSENRRAKFEINRRANYQKKRRANIVKTD